MEKSATQFFLLSLGVCLFFHSTYVYGGLQCGGSVLGAGNPTHRTNARYGSRLYKAQSLEGEMDVYLAIMQEKIHGPVKAWFRES